MREPYIGHVLTRRKPSSRKAHDRTDSAPVKAHIESLLAIGMTRSMIARGAGVSNRYIDNTLSELNQTTLKPYASAVLSLTPRPNKQQALVMAYPSRRRLEGLAVQGWSFPAVSREANIRAEHLRNIRVALRVSWNIHTAIAGAYERLHMRDGGNPQTKAWATREGFVHPLDWDDIDEYEATPLPRMTPDEYRAGEVAFFESLGYSEAEVAAALGIKLDTLQVWKRRTQAVAA